MTRFTLTASRTVLIAGAVAALGLSAPGISAEELSVPTRIGGFLLSEDADRCALESISESPLLLMFSGDGGHRLVTVLSDAKWPVTDADTAIDWRFQPGDQVRDMSGGSAMVAPQGENISAVVLESEAGGFLDTFAASESVDFLVDGSPVTAMRLDGAAEAIAAFRACHAKITGVAF